ncbi:hypothetical protein Avbf_12555 [Armadillidium vulgare]|nr:hypothetical protein Avbf_12555 [Armadillidium vulgare]
MLNNSKRLILTAKNNCHSKPKEIFVKHSDNDNSNISLTSEENETLTSKSGNCNLTPFVNDHIQKSKFKNYRGKPPSKVEFDMNNSVVIVHRNPLLEKFVSENLSSTESNSSYLFPISVSEFKSDLQNSKRKDYTLENKIMENGSISNEGFHDDDMQICIKKEPI